MNLNYPKKRKRNLQNRILFVPLAFIFNTPFVSVRSPGSLPRPLDNNYTVYGLLTTESTGQTLTHWGSS